MRRLWIARINAASQANGMSYSQFIESLKKADIDLNRKVLADMAVREPASFADLVRQGRSAQ
jgi:large subunit ribosomal protein L20